MSTTPRIIDESNERKYFTIVPNYIVNHSTIFEQGIYLLMKRIAGENGQCFASQKTIAEKAGVSQPTTSRIIKSLVRRGWIRQEGFHPGKTRPVKTWRIIDLWDLNNEYYAKKIDKPQNISIKNRKDSVITEYKIDKPQNKEEEKIEEDNTTKVVLKQKGFGNNLVNLILEEFKTLVGFYPTDRKPRWEANILVKQMTTALKRKLGDVPNERVEKAIKFYFNWISEKDWASGIQTLSTVRRKLPVFLAEYKL